MFTQEELNALLQLINRVSVNGQEAELVVHLKNKIRQGLEPQKEEAPKKK